MNFNNPLDANKFPEIQDLFIALLNVFVIIATPIVVFFIILAGFLYVTARGNAEQIARANKALLYGVIGGVVIIGSTAILAIIKNAVNAF